MKDVIFKRAARIYLEMGRRLIEPSGGFGGIN